MRHLFRYNCTRLGCKILLTFLMVQDGHAILQKKNSIQLSFFSDQICSQLFLKGACGAQKELVLTKNTKFFGEGSFGVFVKKGR